MESTLTKEEIRELRLNFIFGYTNDLPLPLHLLAKLEARRLWRKWESNPEDASYRYCIH